VASFFACGPIRDIEIGRFRELTSNKNILWAALDAGDAKAGSIRCTRGAANDKESNTYRIFVNKNHAAAVQFVTLTHELAHLFLGHLGADNALQVKDRSNLNYQQEELEAESVAYIVCKRNSVTSKSEAYLANFVNQYTTIGNIDIYQVMHAAGQIETLLGLGAKANFKNAG
jgi:hypothetical protein